MQALADLIRWIITDAVSHGFWHFVAVWTIVLAIARFTTLVSIRVEQKTEKKKGEGE